MSIIKVIPPSASGVTYGIGCLTKLLNEHPKQLLAFYRIDKGSLYTFIGLFREPGSLGSLVAFINEWGTATGYNGTGPAGFKAMMDCIEKHDVDLNIRVWEDIPKEWREKLRSEASQTVAERLKNWEDWLVEEIYDSGPILPWDDF